MSRPNCVPVVSSSPCVSPCRLDTRVRTKLLGLAAVLSRRIPQWHCHLRPQPSFSPGQTVPTRSCTLALAMAASCTGRMTGDPVTVCLSPSRAVIHAGDFHRSRSDSHVVMDGLHHPGSPLTNSPGTTSSAAASLMMLCGVMFRRPRGNVPAGQPTNPYQWGCRSLDQSKFFRLAVRRSCASGKILN